MLTFTEEVLHVPMTEVGGTKSTSGRELLWRREGEEGEQGEEELGGVRYFTAVYPHYALVEACVQCHNNHGDSPRAGSVKARVGLLADP